MADQISERDEVTLRVLAVVDRTTFAEQRRRALAAYAAEARRDPDVAEIVRLTMASRRNRVTGDSNVIYLRTDQA